MSRFPDPEVFRTPHEKFLRGAEHDLFWESQHRRKVRFTGGAKPTYQAVCSCSWAGPIRGDRADAEADLAGHSEPRRTPSPEEIEAARTPNGGWTQATLESWGVPWPPPKGWKKRLEGGSSA